MFWLILYSLISLSGFFCAILFLIRKDYAGVFMFLVIGLLMAVFAYSAWQARRAQQGKAVKESKAIGIIMLLWWAGLGIGGILGGISFFILGKTTYEYIYGVFGVFMGFAFLTTARGQWREIRKQPQEGISAKIEKIAGKSPAKINKKIILIIAGIIILIVLTLIFFKAASFEKKAKPASQEFDFPVWSLRQGEVTVFRQDKYFNDSAIRNIVIGNTSAQDQKAVKIYDVIPASLAEDVKELSFNTPPEIVQTRNPVVLGFQIEKIAPQKSAVIEIFSRKNFKDVEKMCAAGKISDCASYVRQISNIAEEQARAKYQPEAEEVFSAYFGNEPSISSGMKQFIQNVRSKSTQSIAAAENSKSLSGPASFQIQKIFFFFKELADKVKIIAGKNENKEEKSAPPSTALTENFFPKNFMDAWVLAKAQEAPVNSSICQAVAPLKTMNAEYVVAEKYKSSLLPSQKSKQLIQMSVFQSLADRDQALKGCTGRDARIASGYQVEIQYKEMGFDVKRFMAVQDNYLIILPGTPSSATGYIAPAWDEFTFSQKILPKIREQIKLNY